MANISEGNLSLLQEIVTVAADDSRGDGRSDEEDETITTTKEVNIDDQVVGDLSDLTSKAMGRKGITMGVVVRLEDGHELEVCTMVVGEKRGLEEDYEEVTKKLRQEDMQHTRHISPSTSVSDPGSSDSLSTEIVEGEVTVEGDEEDSDTDAAVSDHEEEDDYFPLSGYPLVDRFPDLGCDLAEPECGCCHCDLSDKLGPTTSEPDLVLYSDRTSDTVRSDCRYFTDRQARDTGYNFWEVED